jgi:hypothetical protein
MVYLVLFHAAKNRRLEPVRNAFWFLLELGRKNKRKRQHRAARLLSSRSVLQRRDIGKLGEVEQVGKKELAADLIKRPHSSHLSLKS